MNPPTASPRSTRARLLAVALLLSLLGSLLGSWVVAGVAGAQERHVVVVGDSVILGAQSAMVGAFSGAGWSINFDAAVNRSTSAGADAIDSHALELYDTLVINLGANDAGNTGAYRQRVDRILASTAGVPHVYWLTIREVRDYYPAANQALRDAAAGHPNVTVLDWNGVTAGRTDLTSSDGLHLNGAGAAAMTELVTGAAFNGVVPAPAAPAALPPPPVETSAPTTAAPEPPVTEAPTTVPTTLAEVPTTVAATTTLPGTTTTVRHTDREVAEASPASDSSVDYGNVFSWTLGGGFAVVVVLLALGGAGLGGWALVATRARAPSPPPVARAVPSGADGSPPDQGTADPSAGVGSVPESLPSDTQ